MSLRVAIDLDGTVADLSRAMHGLATKRFKGRGGEPPSETQPSDSGRLPTLRDLVLRPSELDDLWAHVLRVKNFWTTLDEMEPGVVARIAALASERRWDVLFITTRPTAAGATTQVQSQEWLSAHGFERPSVYVVKGSRGKVAAALDLDAVVDDRPENCLDVATESSAKAILVWPGSVDELGPGLPRHHVVVTQSITAALDELVTLDRARSGGVVRSLKRLLRRG